MSRKSVSAISIILLVCAFFCAVSHLQSVAASQFTLPSYFWSDSFNNGVDSWAVNIGGTGSFTNTSTKYYTAPYSFHMVSKGASWAYAMPPANKPTSGSNAALSQINYSQNYVVDLRFYLPSSDNHWIIVFLNRHISSVIDSGTMFTTRSGSVNTPVVSLNVTTWYWIRYWVEPVNSTYQIDVYNCLLNKYIVTQVNRSFQGSSAPSGPFLIGDADQSNPSSNWGEAYWDDISIHFSAIPLKVTFRLLAVEGFFGAGNALDESGGAVAGDFPMKSAEYLIEALTTYNNWKNMTYGAFNYTSYIHLLSNASVDPQVQKYYRGTPTNASVTNEIQNFLGQTGPGESNDLTIRIFYYNGHSGATPGAYSNDGHAILPRYYLCLGVKGSDPAGPSQYQELYDNQLDTLLKSGSLASSNCVLVILDSCYSGGFISKLKHQGRVILTAVKSDELAWGWKATPLPGYWSWFTGSAKPGYPPFFANIPVGLLGALSNKVDTNGDGWLSANDFFAYCGSTVNSYATNASKAIGVKGFSGMVPQQSYGVVGGEIPIAMINPLMVQVVAKGQFLMVPRSFPFNGLPVFQLNGTIIPSQNYRCSASRTGYSEATGPTTNAQLWTFSLNSSIYTSAAIADGFVFIATLGGGGGGGGGAICALDMKTGAVLWSFSLDSSVHSSPAVANGTVYFGTDSGQIYAVEEHTGCVKWAYQLSTSGILSSPVVGDGKLFLGTQDGYIDQLNATDGELLADTYVGGSVGSAVYDKQLDISASTNGAIFCVDKNGVPMWSRTMSSAIYSTPSASLGRVLFGSTDGKVYCLNETSGSILWNFPTPGPVMSSPALDANKMVAIVASDAGILYALDITSGTPRWSQSFFSSVGICSPAISSNGLVYIGASNGLLSCFNETNGALIWNRPMASPVLSSPAISDGHLYIGSADGSMNCFGSAFPEHNVAVQNLTGSATIIHSGRTINIIYNATNLGNVAETFNIIVAYSTSLADVPPLYNQSVTIHSETVSLGPGSKITHTFAWNTSGLSYGLYGISVCTTPVHGETETGDNQLVSAILITIQGDTNGDRTVNVLDLILVANHLGHTNGDGHLPYSIDWYKCMNTDLNNDGQHNVLDLILCANHLGQHW